MLNPYLFYDSNCEEALKHYADLECELVAGANDAALLSIGFGGGHVVITVGILSDPIQRLAGVVGQNAVEHFARLEDFIRLLADGAMGAVYVTHNLEEAVRLADRIVVLSRRPGRVREVVGIPMTRGERGDIGARGKLLTVQNELWALIREGAIDAEREVQRA